MIDPYVKSFSESELEELRKIMEIRCKQKHSNPFHRNYIPRNYDITSQAVADSKDRMGLS